MLGPALLPVRSPDTPQYVSVAADLGSGWSRDRTPVYPLLIRLCQSIAGERWAAAVVLAQVAMLAALAGAVSRLLRRNGVGPLAAVLVSVASCATPSLVLYSRFLLPEVLMAVLVALACITTLRAMDASSPVGPAFVAGLAGFLSGAAALTKPVWLLGALPLAAGILLAHRLPTSIRRRAAWTLICVHAAVVLSWQAFLFQRFDQLKISRTGTAALNLAAIRLGMTHFGAGTPLYRHLESAGLLDAALRLRFEDLAEFNRIKEGIPMDLRADPEFQRRAVLDHLGDFVPRQLSRMPAFFLTRPLDFGLARGGGGATGTIRSIHAAAYAIYFRLRVGPLNLSPCFLLLLIAAACALRQRQSRDLYGVGLLCIASFALETVMLSYQDSTLARFRLEVEPVLLIVTLLPLWSAVTWLDRARIDRPHDPPAS